MCPYPCWASLLHQFHNNWAVTFYRFDNNFDIFQKHQITHEKEHSYTLEIIEALYTIYKFYLITNKNKPPTNVSRAPSDRGLTVCLYLYGNVLHICFWTHNQVGNWNHVSNSDLRMQQQKLKTKLPPCPYEQINRQYNYKSRGKMTWSRNW